MPVAVQVQVSRADLQRVLRRLESLRGDSVLEEILDDAGDEMLEQVRQRFRQQRSPDGRFWPKSARAQQDGGRTLYDTGRLLSTMVSSSDDETARVGSPLGYAAAHQNPPSGGRRRAFLGMSSRNQRSIVELAVEHLGGS